jgi:predicted nucleic acid-binding Zn ribbon protein
MSIKKRNRKMRILWIIISALAVLAMVGFTIAPALMYL